MSSHDDMPGTSNDRKSRSKRRDKSQSRSSNSSSGTMPSPSAHFGRRPENRPSNGVKGSRMLDRVLVANAFAAEMSTDESNSSPNSEHNLYGSSKLAKGNNDKKNKNKNKKSKDGRKSTPAGLKGYSGSNPSLSHIQHGISDDSDEETRSPAEIRALCASGLRVFPREQQTESTIESAVQAAAGSPADPASPDTDTPMSTSPSPSSRTEKTHPSIQLTTTTTTKTTTIPTATSSCTNITTPVSSASTVRPVTPLTTLPTPTTPPSPTFSPTAPANNNSNHSLENISNNSSVASSTSEPEPPTTATATATAPASQQQTATDLDKKDEAMISPGMSPVSLFAPSIPSSRKRPKSSIGSKAHDDEDNKEEEKKTIPPPKKKKKSRGGAPPKLICADDTDDDPMPDPVPAMAPATTTRRKSVYSEAGKKPKPNISDELYRVPFKYGWKREVVTPSPLTTRSNHIFYTSPCGKKCRKICDIIPMLKGELTKEHFIFGTHILGAEAQFETIRQALSRDEHLAALKERRKSLAADTTKANRKRRQTLGAESHSKPQAEAGRGAFGKRLKSIDELLSMADLSMEPLAARVVAAPVIGKRVPKPKMPKGASPIPEGWTATMAVKGNARLLAAATNGKARAAASSTASGSSCAAPVRQEMRATCGFCLKLIEGSVCQCCVQSAEGADAVPLMGEYDNEGESEESYQAGTVSNGLEVIKVLEPPGEMPPAELLSTDTSPVSTPINLYMHQEVVVISGQKAISAVAEPAMTSQQKVVVPNPPDLTSYQEFYDKRIAAPKESPPPHNPWVKALGSDFNCRFLISIIQTLNQQERANCTKVSKLWHLCSRDANVWKSVSLRDTKVNNWPALVREMARNSTRDLDMMGAIIPTSGTLVAGDMRLLTDMRTVRTDHTKADFLHQIFRCLTQLEKLICTCVSSGLNMTDIDKIENLNELRVRMTDTKASITGLPLVGKLTHLSVLSLRGVKNLGSLLFLKDLPNLETLILGYCQSMHRLQLGNEVLPALTKLQMFRIETDQRKKSLFPVDEIMRGLAQAGSVRRLELVNVDVDRNFSQMLSNCPTVEELLLIPKCQTNSALMVRAAMEISGNGSQLKLFKLVLVTQLLTATSALTGNPDVPMVPVVRPVPGIPLNDPLNNCSEECHEQGHAMCVAVLPFERLKTIMAEMMPNSSPSVVTMAMVDTPTIQLGRLPPNAAAPTLNF